MNRSMFFVRCFILVLVISLCLNGCMSRQNLPESGSIPEIPDKLERSRDDVPVLKVYNTQAEKTEDMDIESYIMGVVAGEMKNTWPIEALKAQAILARTFTMKFVSDKESAYEGSDISTDIHEAQAYNAEDINDNIREAVNETRGMMMVNDGDFTHAWFHAHSGGITELPSKALEYSEDPAYLSVVKSHESAKAPADVQNWRAAFSKEEVLKACENSGVQLDAIESFEIGERGESGRAVTFLVNGKTVSAPTFRLQIGASKLKSTLIESINVTEERVQFTGRGFGHGVGMSQWGAHQMAEDGKSAEDIIRHYYSDVELIELW